MSDNQPGFSKIERIAFGAVRWIGSAQSIIIHTIIFATIIAILLSGIFSFDVVILVFNTAVSLEAIYLALFIQMTVNHQGQSIKEVEQDIGEIQEDVDEIQEDIDEIQEDVEEMSEEDQTDERTLEEMHTSLKKLVGDIERLQSRN
jgi:peptidoglycan hydrolase CwlO-like protein